VIAKPGLAITLSPNDNFRLNLAWQSRYFSLFLAPFLHPSILLSPSLFSSFPCFPSSSNKLSSNPLFLSSLNLIISNEFFLKTANAFSDDICMPGRLERQLSIMASCSKPPCVLGTAVEVFWTMSHGHGPEGEMVGNTRPGSKVSESGLQGGKAPWIASHPTSARMVAWTLPFSCCVAHPSVIMSRQRVLQVIMPDLIP